MEPESSLPHSPVSITHPYPELDQSSLCPPSQFLKIHHNIFLPSTPRSSKWSLFLRFLHQHSVYTSPLLHSATCPSHLILLDLIAQLIFYEEYRSCSSLLYSYSVLHSTVTSSLLGPYVLGNLFSATVSLCSSLIVNYQVSHPCKTTGKIIVLCILIFVFLDSPVEDQSFCTKR